MNNRLLKTALGIALGLGAAAVPGYCTPITLSFGAGSQGSDTVVVGIPNGTQGSSDTLSSFAAAFNTITIGGATTGNGDYNISGGGLTWNSSSDTFSIAATLTSCDFDCTGTSLTGDTVTIMAAMTFPYNATTSLEGFYESGSGATEQATVDFGTTASLSISGTLAAALDAANSGTLNSGGGISTAANPTASGSGSTEKDTYITESPVLGVTLGSQIATPEPASLFLLGSGLLVLGWARRKRSARA